MSTVSVVQFDPNFYLSFFFFPFFLLQSNLKWYLNISSIYFFSSFFPSYFCNYLIGFDLRILWNKISWFISRRGLNFSGPIFNMFFSSFSFHPPFLPFPSLPSGNTNRKSKPQMKTIEWRNPQNKLKSSPKLFKRVRYLKGNQKGYYWTFYTKKICLFKRRKRGREEKNPLL